MEQTGKRIKEKYAVLVPHAKTRLDLNYIIGEMIAELACADAYVSPGEIKGPYVFQWDYWELN